MSQVSDRVFDGSQTKKASSIEKTSSWESAVYEVLLSAASPESLVPIPIEGGSDSGLFCIVGSSINPAQLIYHPIISSSSVSPKKPPSILRVGDVILEIGEYQISGFTRLDAIRLCETLFRADLRGDRTRVLLKLIPPSAIPTGDAHLSHFLSAQFHVGTPEFLLQEVTRNNIYQRVVPCTTRERRPEERDGVDYQFFGVERFLALEKSGQLLESGVYKGNHYGTPRPDPNATALNLKPRPETFDQHSAASIELPCQSGPLQQQQQDHQIDRSSIALPDGWEVIEHPDYGLFYVDHVNQKTQYEPPTKSDFEEAARLRAPSDSTPFIISTDITNNSSNSQNQYQTSSSDASDKFTDDAEQIRGPLVTAVMVKGPKGFGFTIIGGSSPGRSRFLQVKNVIAGEPAALEGTLDVGNVLVSANGVNVLGFSHDQIVNLLHSIPVGGTVTLTVSQGYSLPSAESKQSQHQPSITAFKPELSIRRLNTSPTISQLSGEADDELASSMVGRSGTVAGTAVMVSVAVTKRANGFGFTLADRIGGQRVKEVLEPTGLRVGDIVLGINGKWVKGSSHLEVVQLLKLFPIGQTAKFVIQRVVPISADKNYTDDNLNSNFTRIPDCDSPRSFDGNDVDGFSPSKSFRPTFSSGDCNMIQSMTASTSAPSRYRSRTPGPGEESRRSTETGMIAELGSSSDCIYSVGESLNGLEFCRCPSPTLNTVGFNSGLSGDSGGATVWSTGLKRYGGTDFDAYCLQQGLSRCNPFGSGQLPHLSSDYESLPRCTTASPHVCGEFFVNLRREANGFGFKLLGGSEEGTQLTIGHLAPGGSAERSGQMLAGDRLVSVNGTRVLGGSHAKALALLEVAAEVHREVTLGLWRPPPPIAVPTSTSASMVRHGSRSTECSEPWCWQSNAATLSPVRSVLLKRAPGEEGFGFVLANAPSKQNDSKRDGQVNRKIGDHYISRVVAGSASDRSRLLHVDDRLLSVNGINVEGLHLEEVIRLVKAAGSQLALTVLPNTIPVTPSYEQMQFYNSQLCQQQQLLHQHQKARTLCFQVTLFRSSRGFGFSIRGGHEFNQMPLTVLRVAEGGPAHLDGRLKVGDELLQINGFMTAGMSHRRAVEIIQAGGNTIRLCVRRLLQPVSDANSLAVPPPQLSYAPFGSLLPAPPSISLVPPAPRAPLPPPPNLRFPQFFTPLPVPKSSLGPRHLLSSVKNPSTQRSLIAYRSLPRLWQRSKGFIDFYSSSSSSSLRNLEALSHAPDRYHPCNIQL